MADPEEVGIDQEVFDREIAAGKPERVARALAKSAYVRKQKAAQGPAPAGPAAPAAPSGEAPVAAAAPAAAAAVTATQAPAGDGGASVPRMTPEERAARVAAATGTSRATGGGGRGTGAGETHRLLAMVPPAGIQRVEKRQDDKVNVWPHLLASEFLSLLIVLAGLIVFSAIVNAPFRDLANPSLTPNPSKAPWYFLGLQELLRYFHPMIAGVTIPGLGMFALFALPYADKNPSVQPERRKLAVVLFTMFIMMWSVLVITGWMFRGPGFNFVWPWDSGLYLDL